MSWRRVRHGGEVSEVLFWDVWMKDMGKGERNNMWSRMSMPRRLYLENNANQVKD